MLNNAEDVCEREEGVRLIVAGIPAYNEEKTIARVILLAQRHVDMVIVCDDGSDDLTADIACKLGATVIRHDKNYGYGAALQSLFKKARELDAKLMLTLDGDGQHDPEEVPKIVHPILKGEADIVLGSRLISKRNEIPAYRRLGIKIITRMSKGSNHRLSDAQCGFRAYSKKAIESLHLNERGMGASAEILFKANEQGLRVIEVPVHTFYRGLHTSTQNWFRHGLSVVLSIIKLVVEGRPLLYLGMPGLIFLLSGLFLMASSLQVFVVDQLVAFGMILWSIVLLLIGLFAVFTAFTLYAILRLTERGKTKHGY